MVDDKKLKPTYSVLKILLYKDLYLELHILNAPRHLSMAGFWRKE